MKKLNTLSQQFVDHLSAVTIQEKNASSGKDRAQKVHINGAGRAITYAYEQLRNAAEYADDHLLQFAIKRFFKRLFILRDENILKDSGEELIIELTLAGYIAND